MMHSIIKKTVLLIVLLVFCLGSLEAAKINKDEFERLRVTDKLLRAHIGEMEAEFEASPTLNKYKVEYFACVASKQPKPVAAGEMSKRINQARFVFLGDEHTTVASQKATLKVIGIMLKKKAPLTLVLEWIDESHQKDVDLYLAGKLALKTMRKKIDFDKDWGFTWSSYAKILAAAKKYRLPVLLVERLKQRHSLSERDAYIAKKLAADAKANPDMRYLTIYGEYHLIGPEHLTHKCSKLGLKPQIIMVGEAAETYWQLLAKTMDPEKIGFAHLKKDLYYINAGTPLERSFSYRNYLMDILDYEPEDFGDDIRKADIVPHSASASRFDQLHKLPAN